MLNYYSKGEGSQELKSVLETKGVSIVVGNKLLAQSLSDNYTKTEGYLDPSLFIIVSGGEKRERDYFSTIQNNSVKFPRIELQFVAQNSVKGNFGLNVEELVNEGLRIKNEKADSKANDIEDAIYLVTDVDHFYSEIVKYSPICRDNGLKLIISNPCFEIWLYYSYYNCKPDSWMMPENKLEISSSLKTWINTIHKGGIDPRKTIFEIQSAIKNAKNYYDEDHNGIPQLFSTQMFQLAEEFHKLIDSELILVKLAIENKRKKNVDLDVIECLNKP